MKITTAQLMEKIPKLIFLGKIAYRKKFRFFGGNPAVSPFDIYDGLTSCAKAKKSVERNSRFILACST